MKISSLQKGLVGHWTMAQDSLKGSLLADKTPYENDGTIYGATFTTDRKGKANSAMSFDGVNDYIDCGNGANLNMTDKITISAWIKLYNKVNSGRIVHKGGQTNNYLDYSLIIGDNGKISFGASKTSNTILRVRDVDSLELHTWYYIVGIFDGANYAIYLNGNKKKTTNAGLSNSNINTLNIGRRNDGEQYFNGLIDDVRIYNRALSQEEITLLYNSYNPKIIL
jgi:hypothetical protein